MNFSKRSYQLELLDADGISFEEIKLNMEELDTINSLLGGHAITIAGLKKTLPSPLPDRPIRVVEIGCGGGDNLIAIQRWALKRRISIEFIGIDIKTECIDFARSRNGEFHAPVEWIVSDYKEVHWGENQPDIIFSSLFCHHFRNEELVWMMKWMERECRSGFFINDLHRHYLAYHSIRLLTLAFSKSRLVKNDAPISVTRGFNRADWQRILADAGLSDYHLNWKWAFRWLLTYQKIPSTKLNA